MKVIIAGGGTGGHIYPAVTIGKALQEKGADLLFVGTRRGLEKEIVPQEGFPLEYIAVDAFPRRLSLSLAKAALTALKGVAQARRLVKEFDPDVCIGTGGYVAGPVVLAASLRGVPTVIQEQNAYPGVTNRILARFVDKIALGYEEASRHFRSKDKLVYTGNPIRPQITETSRVVGAKRLSLDPKQRLLLIFGASQGARSINTAVLDGIPLLKTLDTQVLVATGSKGFSSFVEACRQRSYDLKPMRETDGYLSGNVRIVPYIYDMPAALAAADLVVGRGGAVSIAELTAKGLPALIVPYPHAAENHQEANARVLEKARAAKVVLDHELNGKQLVNTVRSLLCDAASLRRMAEASRGLGKPDAVWEIVAMIEGLVASRSPHAVGNTS